MSKSSFYVPTGWSAFSTKPVLEQILVSKQDKFYKTGSNHGLSREEMLKLLEIAEFDVQINPSLPVVLIPIYYHGVGDWIRADYCIKSIYHQLHQEIHLIIFDTPVARSLVENGLKKYVKKIYWIPQKEPFFSNEIVSSLDWVTTESHLFWDLIGKEIETQTRNHIVLRSPNRRLPPYTNQFEYDYRIAIHSDKHQKIEINLYQNSSEFANKWWASHGLISQFVIAIGLRADTQLLSEHRNTNIATIETAISVLAQRYPQAKIIFFGDKPLVDINTSGLKVIDFCESWKSGHTLIQQAAILAKCNGVIGYNSGSIDIPLSCGVPGLRIRTHRPPSPYFNDNLASLLMVNVMTGSIDNETITKATHLFLNLLEEKNTGVYYVNSDEICSRVDRSITPLDISNILLGKSPKFVKITEVESIDTHQKSIVDIFRDGNIPLVIKQDIENYTFLKSDGYDFKYIDLAPWGVACSEKLSNKISSALLTDVPMLKSLAYSGIMHYIVDSERSQLHVSKY